MKFFPTTLTSIVGLSLAICLIIGPTGAAFAQAQTGTPATTPASTPAIAPPNTAAEQAALEAQLNDVLQQIAAQQQVLSQEQQTASSIQRDITILQGQIKEAQLEIQAHQLAIQALGQNIDQKNQTIVTLGDQINQSDASLADLIRQTNEEDGFSFMDVLLSNTDISNYFIDDDEYQTLRQDMIATIGVIEQSESDTEAAKQALTVQKLQQTAEQISVEDEQNKIVADQNQEKTLLALSKAKQATYQSVINQKEAQATAIRNALFVLRDTAAIPFGTALQYADEAQKITGVNPAFLLAILTQESDLGENVGSCYLTNDATGAGVKVTTGAYIAKVMNPSRDVPPFLQITASLGRDPSATKVSCPIGGTGWGGAMGPAQFIASTWAIIQSRIAAATGDNPPDPWNPQDAFMASALFLSDLGAGSGTTGGELQAACSYYGTRGYTCAYGRSVMSQASSIQTNMIDPLEGE
jgi:membrane-bound lytic murein transglycosylase B